MIAGIGQLLNLYLWLVKRLNGNGYLQNYSVTLHFDCCVISNLKSINLIGEIIVSVRATHAESSAGVLRPRRRG